MRDTVRVYHLTELKDRRRDLRRKSTPSEKLLWEKLRNNKIGCKFRRQYSVRGYVMDFYCPEKRLGIELEGGIHNNPKNKVSDKYRYRYLEAFGIKILRISNEKVLKNIEEVEEEIKRELLCF